MMSIMTEGDLGPGEGGQLEVVDAPESSHNERSLGLCSAGGPVRKLSGSDQTGGVRNGLNGNLVQSQIDGPAAVTESQMFDPRSPARFKVLLVDDSSFCRKLMRMVLERTGIDVITLDSPFRFNLVVREANPDLALVDVAMPEFSGDHMITSARRQLGTFCPVVFFSDRSEEELASLVAKCGGLGYIRKSPDWDSIVVSVTRFLSQLTPQSREGSG